MAGIGALVGVLFLVGAALLVPGFAMIRALSVEKMQVAPGVEIFIPHFSSFYGAGDKMLIVAMSLLITAHSLQLFAQKGPASLRGSGPRAAALVHGVLGGVLQVVGAGGILAAVVVYLPEYSLAVPPATILGTAAPDLGKTFLRVGSISYGIASLIGVVEGTMSVARGHAQVEKKVELLGSCCFLLASCLFLRSCFMTTPTMVEQGYQNIGAAVAIFLGVLAFTAASVLNRPKAAGSQPDSQIALRNEML